MTKQYSNNVFFRHFNDGKDPKPVKAAPVTKRVLSTKAVNTINKEFSALWDKEVK